FLASWERRRKQPDVPVLVLLAFVARRNDCAVHGAGYEVLENAHVAFSPAMNVETHARILHETHEAQQVGVHAEGSADLQYGGAYSLVGRPRTSVKECPATEVGRRQWAHRRRARHVQVLRPGDDVHKGTHLLQGGELLRYDRCLVLRVD